MPGLMQENARTGIKKIAGETLFSHALKQSGNSTDTWIEAGKTDCLSRG